MKITHTTQSNLLGIGKVKAEETDICKRYNYYSSTELGKENKNKRCEISKKKSIKEKRTQML